MIYFVHLLLFLVSWVGSGDLQWLPFSLLILTCFNAYSFWVCSMWDLHIDQSEKSVTGIPGQVSTCRLSYLKWLILEKFQFTFSLEYSFYANLSHRHPTLHHKILHSKILPVVCRLQICICICLEPPPHSHPTLWPHLAKQWFFIQSSKLHLYSFGRWLGQSIFACLERKLGKCMLPTHDKRA